MATKTERADVFKIAFAAAFRDGKDVIRVPQCTTIDSFKAPMCEQFFAPRVPGSLESAVGFDGVGPAEGTYALVTEEDMFPKIPRVGTQTPLVHAVIGTEREAPGRHFKCTPAAKATSILTFWEGVSMNESSWHCPLRAHLAVGSP